VRGPTPVGGPGRPTVSVVVSTRDRPQALAACLDAVAGQEYPGLELVVVDSAPTAATAEEVTRARGCRHLRLDRPGLSRARNAGARAATGEVVVFLDDDILLEPGCLDALVAEFDDARVTVVTGRILLHGGDAAARTAFESFGGFDPGEQRRVVDRDSPGWFEHTNFGGLGTGAVIALRRSVLQSWPGFDERLGRGAAQDGGEELHAYFALVRLGHRVVYTPRAVALHPAPASVGELRRRVLAGASSGAAYMTLLLCEFPGYRRDVLRYACEALRGTRRAWRPRPATARHRLVPRWREAWAWLAGPLRYARMRVMTGPGGRDG